jgi:hypothetical protein
VGHRCNYALLDGGRLQLFYAHWGALTVPHDMFWGPAYAEAFIRAQTPVGSDDWLETAWAEGGAALDKDARALVLFGGSHGLDREPLRPVFLRLMSALWQQDGWSVRWAGDGQADLAEQVGVTRARVEAALPPPEAISVEDAARLARDGLPACLVTVADEDGLRDLVSAAPPASLLANGPEVLASLGALPTLAEAAAGEPPEAAADPWAPTPPPLAEALDEALLVATTERTLSLFTAYPRPSDLDHLRARWPGWTVQALPGGPGGLFALTGRPLPEALKDPEEDAPPALSCSPSTKTWARSCASGRPSTRSAESPSGSTPPPGVRPSAAGRTRPRRGRCSVTPSPAWPKPATEPRGS